MNISADEKVKLAYMLDKDSNFKRDILAKYAILGSYKETKSDETKRLIQGNRDTFGSLTDSGIFAIVASLRSFGDEAKDVFKDNSGLGAILGGNIASNYKALEVIAKECGLEAGHNNLSEMLTNLQKYNSDNSEPEMLDEDEFGDIDEMFGELDEETFEEEEEAIGEEEDGFEDEEEIEEEEIEVAVAEKVVDADIEELKKAWGRKTSTFVNTILSAYDKVYRSCYGLMIPGGILTNKGMITYNTKEKFHVNGDMATDIELYLAVKSALGLTNVFNSYSNSEPDYKVIKDSKEAIYYAGTHLKWMFGYLEMDETLAEYAKEKGITTSKFTSFEQLRPWMQSKLEGYAYEAYKSEGVTGDIAEGLELVKEIQNNLSDSLKPVIAVVEYKPNVVTKLRICVDSKLNTPAVISKIKSALNAGTSSSIKVKQVGSYNNGVLDIVVIYNDKVYSDDSLFAYQVISIFEEQGIKPSWDKVILGKDDNGEIFTYNFKSTSNPVYALYASSRAGKGVMTLNLLASAFGDNCDVMYIDGKPDMSLTLADLAWKDGKDTFTFNGLQGIPSVLENHPKCPRTVKRFYDKGNVPTGLFSNTGDLEEFMSLTTYMRGLELACLIAFERAANKNNENWMVVVFDEVKQVSSAELLLRDKLGTALERRKKEKGSDGKPLNLMEDTIAKYINGYVDWLDVIKDKFSRCLASTFGFADMTVFFVWQETDFPDKYLGSLVADCVKAASAKMIKIIGARAAMKNGSTSFGTPNSLKESTWYDDRFTDDKKGGYFAIGGDVNNEDTMKVFRPFNVYSDSNNKKKILENALTKGLTESDLVGSILNDDGSVIHEVGFEGYSRALLKGMSVSDQMHKGYLYGESIVKKLNIGDNLLNYMYDMHNFNGSSMGDEEDEDADSKKGMRGVSDGFDMDTPKPSGSGGSGLSAGAGIKAGIKAGLGVGAGGAGAVDDFGDSFEDEFGDRGKVIEDSVNDRESEAFSAMQDSNNLSGGVRKLARDAAKGMGDVDSLTDEEMEDYDKLINNEQVPPEELAKVIANVTGNSSFQQVGKDGKVTVVDINGTGGVSKLDRDNSIDCSRAGVGPISGFAKLCMSTSRGSMIYANKLFKSIVQSITDSGVRATNVTRLSVYGGQMYVNYKIINLNGVLGGYEDIRLQDIINFKQLMKNFKNISDFKIDEDILRAASLEFGSTENALSYIFKKEKRLQEIKIKLSNGKISVLDRNSAVSSKAEVYKDVEVKNNLDTACRNMTNDSWGKTTFGSDIWGWKLAKGQMSKAGAKLRNSKEPKFVGALVSGSIGIVGLSVGVPLWLGVNGIRKLFSFARR